MYVPSDRYGRGWAGLGDRWCAIERTASPPPAAAAPPTPTTGKTQKQYKHNKQQKQSFGGQSPERKASDALATLFTFVAVKVVLAQLSGSGRGALGAYNADGHTALSDLLVEVPMRDGDAWLLELLRRDRAMGAQQSILLVVVGFFFWC